MSQFTSYVNILKKNDRNSFPILIPISLKPICVDLGDSLLLFREIPHLQREHPFYDLRERSRTLNQPDLQSLNWIGRAKKKRGGGNHKVNQGKSAKQK